MQLERERERERERKEEKRVHKYLSFGIYASFEILPQPKFDKNNRGLINHASKCPSFRIIPQ